jgi:glutamyl-tRNA synthetase
MYDRRCLALSPEEVQQKVRGGEPHVLRLKIPHEEIFTFDDSIRGRVTFRGDTIDDQVLLKSDGFPTYHLAHVADDHLMEIDTVIRGEEWLSSVPKHLLLFQCFGWKPPQYAHVPLLLNKTRAKLSKRDGAVAVEDYIAKGYVPEALLNFIALLGWNPGTTQELFSLQELIEAFSLERVQKGGAVFDAEKLDWLQGQWMRKMAPEEFAKHIHPLIAEKFSSARTDGAFAKKAALIQGRITFFTEATEMLAFFYEEPTLTRDLLVHAKQ